MKIFVAGLSYKTAPVELREKLAVHASRLHCHGCRLKIGANLSEVVLLSTCNRVEIYGVTPKVNGNVHNIFQHLSASLDTDISPYIYIKEGSQAVHHLFSVAGGMDSMVIGETEITGQVKQAYQTAQQAKLTGRVLNRVFQTALQTAKEIRTQTQIGRAYCLHQIFRGRPIVKHRRRRGGRIQSFDDGSEIRLRVAPPMRQGAH